MAIARVQIFSQTLRQHTSLTVAMPDIQDESRRTYPVLYLLHGGTEDSTIWFREAAVEDIAVSYGLIAVSIDALSSCYCDMVHGGAYFTYLTDELPKLMARHLPISTARKDTLIGGFSMGGQGALKAALRFPQQYGACIAMSGARDMTSLYQQWAAMPNGPDMRGVEDALGPIDQIRGGENDVVYLAEQAAAYPQLLPKMYLSCGDDDYAVALSLAYHDHLTQLGIKHDYFRAPGTHCYAHGEKALRHALDDLWQGRKKT